MAVEWRQLCCLGCLRLLASFDAAWVLCARISQIGHGIFAVDLGLRRELDFKRAKCAYDSMT